jgi:hypothetical protein
MSHMITSHMPMDMDMDMDMLLGMTMGIMRTPITILRSMISGTTITPSTTTHMVMPVTRAAMPTCHRQKHCKKIGRSVA